MTTVRIVESGGIPVVPVESGAPLLIASDTTGFPITLVERFGAPFVVRGAAPSTPWYDEPEFDDFEAGIRMSDNTAFIATGPKEDGRYPKTAATFAELFNFTAPAGRGYMPTGSIPYVYDSAANEPRFDGQRMAYEPLPRFNRVFPSGEFVTPISIYLINYPYLFSFYGTGSITVTGAEVPGGTWTLNGTGSTNRTWGIMPHPVAGDVTVTPTGDVRFINADTHGVSGYDPDYPTNTIETEDARVDQAAETLQFSTALMDILSQHEGTLVVQGQFWAPATDTTGGRGRRIALGWDHNAYLGVDMDGNAVNNTGWGVALSTPLGSGGNGDTFRLAISWRGQSGGASDGIRRMAGNGGDAVEHAHPWNGGLGDHSLFTLGRASNEIFGQESGGGRYDYFLFNSELLSLEEVSFISELT